MRRIALLHTGAVVIPAFAALTTEYWPGVEVLNLLDDRVVADLRAQKHESVAQRLVLLAKAASAAGAEAVVFTCSSISGFARDTELAARIDVLRIDEAMADIAAGIGGRIAVVATLPTTLEPTCSLLRERLALSGRDAHVERVLVEGAFEAIVAGDRARHDHLIGAELDHLARSCDVVVLAQASMASAATGTYPVPVLSSPESGVRRVAEALGIAG